MLLVLTGASAYDETKRIIGTGETPSQLRKSHPGCIRATMGTDEVNCGALVSQTPIEAWKHIVTFFREKELCADANVPESGLALTGAAVMSSFIEPPQKLRSIFAISGDRISNQISKVLKMLRQARFDVVALRLLPPSDIDSLLNDAASTPQCKAAIIVVERANAINRIRTFIGSVPFESTVQRGRDSVYADSVATTFRAAFDRLGGRIVVGAATSPAQVTELLVRWFPALEAGHVDPEIDIDGLRFLPKRAHSLIETVCVVFPPGVILSGEIEHLLDGILREDYKLVQIRTCCLSDHQAQRYAQLSGADTGSMTELINVPVTVVALERINAVTQFRMLLAKRSKDSPTQTLILSSLSVDKARKELAFFFGNLLFGEDTISYV